MSITLKSLRQCFADQTGAAADEHTQRRTVKQLFVRALCSGSCASVVSSVLVSWFSYRRSHAAAAGTNATSQWIWPRQAHRRTGWSIRHTVTGYLIHHASSVFWATGYETLRRGRCSPQPVVTLAAATAVTAYLVDYKVVPSRMTPGFERRLQPADMFCIYAAFGMGLALPWLLTRAAARA